jgi:hypothetical protein
MRRIALLALIVAAVAAQPAQAAPPICTTTAVASGDWASPATWSGGIPGAASHVCIPAGRTVTLTSASVQTMQVGGTLTVTGALALTSTVDESTLSGTLAGPGGVSVAGLLTWSNGTMSGTGTTTIAGRLVNTGYTTLADGRVLENLGTIELPTDNRYVSSSGAAPLIRNLGTIRRTATGTTGVDLRVPVENDGTIVSDGGELELTNGGTGSGGDYGGGAGTVRFGGGTHELVAGATLLDGSELGTGELRVADGATVAAVDDVAITGGTLAGSGTLAVQGTLTWSNGTMRGPGTTTVAATAKLVNTGYTTLSEGRVLENLGTVELPTDNRYVSGSGVEPLIRNGGTIRRTATGTTGIDLRVPVENDGTIVSDGGELELTDGGPNSSGDYGGGAGTVRFGGGVHELVAGARLLDGFELGAGELRVADGAAVDAVDDVAIEGGAVSGPGALAVQGTLTWSNGTMRGPGTTTVAAPAKLVNTGYTTLADGRVLENLGTLELPTDNRYVSRSGAAPLIRNRGTIRRTATGASGVDLRLPVENHGAIVSDGGQLSLTGGGSGSSTAVFGGGAGTTRLTGTWQLDDGARLAAGTQLNATVTIGAGDTVTATGAALTGGTIVGAGTLAVTGPFAWTGGTMGGSGATAVAAGATLSLPADGGFQLAGTRTLTVDGLLDVSGDNSLFGAQALLHIRPTGTLRKSGGDSWTFVDVQLRNDGAVEAQTGELRLLRGVAQPQSGRFTSASEQAFVALAGEGHLLTGAARLSDFTRIDGDVTVRAGDTLTVSEHVVQTDGALAGDVLITGTLTWSGGSHEAPGTTTIEAGGELVIDREGTACAFVSLGDARTVVNRGDLRLVAGSDLGAFGDVRAEIHNAGRIELDSGDGCGASAGISGDALLRNTGVIEKVGGAGSSFVGSSLENDGTVVDSAPGELRLESNAAIGHSGTFRGVTFEGGTFALDPGAAVEGDTAIAGADLQLPDGMTLAVPAGATLRLSSGSILGAGSVTVSGTLAWSGGGLEGSGTTVIEAGGNALLAPPEDDDHAYLSLGDDRSLVNRGSMTATATSLDLGGGASLLNRGTLELAGASRLGGTGYGSGYAALLHNAGTLRTAAGSDVRVDLPVDNDGVIEAGTGTLDLRELLNWTGNGFYGESGVAGGAYVVRGTLVLPGVTNVNGARLVLDGAASQVVARSFVGGYRDALAGLRRNAGGAELVLRGGRSLELQGGLVNEGVLDLGAGSTLRANGFRQAAGAVLRPAVTAGGSGRVISTGPAQLGGRLDTPSPADVAGETAVLKAPALSGAFAAVTGAYQAIVGATDVRLVPPAPVGPRAVAPAAAGELRIDGAAFSTRGPWLRRGAYLVARRGGATLTAPAVRGSGLALVARTCRRCGAVRVSWGTGKRRVVSLRSRRAARRTIRVFGAGRGTVRLRTTSARRVAIDALLVTR